ncbi:MAG: polymer-forming cytoskeletal protein [Lewinella sp.]|nr:polymer-forming cytoskeletal protein [Lewinella sp.]
MRTFLLFIAILAFGHFSLQATTIKGEQNVQINTPLEEDLYVGANSLEINAPVGGDVIAAVRYCHIRDTLREDAMLMAQEIDLAAPVMDDARLFGGTITIRADVFGDLMLAGGTITIEPGVVIHGNLYVGSGTLHMNGRVLGESKLAGGEVTVTGTLDGATVIRGENVTVNGTFNSPLQLTSQALTLQDQAKFFADIQYWNEKGAIDFGTALQGNSRAVLDEALRGQPHENNWQRTLGVGTAFTFIVRVLSAALLLFLLVWAFPDFFQRLGAHVQDNYSKSLGYGLIYILGMPLVIILLFVTIIGIPLGLFSIAAYGFSLGWAHILAALLVAYWWQARRGEHWQNSKIVLVAVGVFVGLKLISWIPILGWLIALLVAAMAIGALIREWLQHRHKATEHETV